MEFFGMDIFVFNGFSKVMINKRRTDLFSVLLGESWEEVLFEKPLTLVRGIFSAV